MIDFKLEREELLKTKEEFIKRSEILRRDYEQTKSNINAVEGALMLLDKLEKESKTTDTKDVKVESENGKL